MTTATTTDSTMSTRNDTASSDTTTNHPDDDDALSELLSALVEGVRAVQGLPLDDEFAFERSLPEFSQQLATAQSTLIETIQRTLSSLDDTVVESTDDDFDSIDDPVLWETCADACDALLDQVEAQLQDEETSFAQGAAIDHLQRWSTQARFRSHKSFGKMLEGVVDMEKPQDVYQIAVQNSRTEPFVPPVHPGKPHAVAPLVLQLRKGHGIDTRFGELRQQSIQLPANLMAPEHHVPHVYQDEIRSFAYTDWQLQATKPSSELIASDSPLEATWIDTVEALKELAQRLESTRHVAIDLEAHSYRSFAGLVCLMQLSFREDDDQQNYLVDTLKLHSHMHLLQPVLANPKIVKVMHGADSDVQWLQRDFGLYVVNLFDTGRAARALELPSASLAYLLQHYCNITADKSFQLADWRQRPLPDSMQQYAIQDTHYLLDIYERLKWDLEQKGPELIRQVLDTSRQVCLIRYVVEPFKPDGYKVLLSRRGGGTRRRQQRTELNEVQERILKVLWDWRDRVAREHDESTAYVCPNKALERIALGMAGYTAVSLQALQSLLNPMPPLVLRHAQEVIELIKAELRQGTDNNEAEDDEEEDEIARQTATVEAPSSAFFKPSTKRNVIRRRGLTSPVLGTDALYEQAGWTMPKEKTVHTTREMIVDVTTTTSDEDDPPDEGEKPKRLLAMHPSNKNYFATKPTEHSLELGEQQQQQQHPHGGRGRGADGMGTVHAAREHSKSPVSKSIEEESKAAKQSSTQIRAKLAAKGPLSAMLGLFTPTSDVDEEETTAADERAGEVKNRETVVDIDEEEFAIPRSMREIYKISNRNRRIKAAGSPTPERGVTPTSEKEREELAKAETLLRDRGILAAGLFDDGAAKSPGKRQRTKTTTGRDSEESVPQESSAAAAREEDMAIIRDVGWLQSEAGAGVGIQQFGGGEQQQQKETSGSGTFDYSSVGPIGALAPNPFFSGAALTGGPLMQGQGRSKKNNTRREKSSRKQERPEKREGRLHAYRKR